MTCICKYLIQFHEICAFAHFLKKTAGQVHETGYGRLCSFLSISPKIMPYFLGYLTTLSHLAQLKQNNNYKEKHDMNFSFLWSYSPYRA